MKLAVSLACAVLIAGAVGASAAKKEKPKEKEKEVASSKAALIGSYGEWKVYHVASGKSRYCYISAQPTSRKPDSAKGEKAYAFISERPSERVHDEISFIMGFELATADDLKEAKAGKKGKKGKKGRRSAERAERHDRRQRFRSLRCRQRSVDQERRRGRQIDRRNAQGLQPRRRRRLEERPQHGRHLLAFRLQPGGGQGEQRLREPVERAANGWNRGSPSSLGKGA